VPSGRIRARRHRGRCHALISLLKLGLAKRGAMTAQALARRVTGGMGRALCQTHRFAASMRRHCDDEQTNCAAGFHPSPAKHGEDRDEQACSFLSLPREAWEGRDEQARSFLSLPREAWGGSAERQRRPGWGSSAAQSRPTLESAEQAPTRLAFGQPPKSELRSSRPHKKWGRDKKERASLVSAEFCNFTTA
jgi:hypothetical protein